MSEISIQVDSVSKVYRLYDSSADRLKEALTIRKNRVYHRKHYALSDISFDVKKGETFGIIGTNGAGKSTLLKLITGVTAPTEGTIQVNGKISALLELGAGFNHEYTGLENIYLHGAMMGYSRNEMTERVKTIAEFADIGDFLYQPVKTYSSGMFARLAFAVAINIEPDILIVDEALSVGDIFFQNKCYRKFEELRGRGITVLFVSHDISTVKQMCSRVLWIEKGVQQMVGDSVEVCNAYSNSILAKRAKEYAQEKAVGENAITAEMLLDQLQQSDRYEIGEMKAVPSYPEITFTNESILSDDVQILSNYITKQNGELITECEVNTNYTLHMLFKSKRDIESCIVGFVLETIKGLWVINTNSAINGKECGFPIKASSINHIEFNFTMPSIMNGDYVLGVAVSEGDAEQYRVLTWLYHTLYVRVNNKAKNSAVIDVPTDIRIYEKLLEDTNE